MPARFESMSTPREPIMSNGIDYTFNGDIVISGISGN